MSDPHPARRISSGGAFADGQPGEAVFVVIYSGQLHHLAGVVFVEGKASAAVYDLALGVFVAAKNQAAIFRAFVVVKKHSSVRTIFLVFFLAADDHAGKPRFIGKYHAQSSVRLDDVDSMHFDLVKPDFLIARRESAKNSGGEDDG